MITYQSLVIPQDRKFNLLELFSQHGISQPTRNQLYYMRQWLTDNGYVKELIHGINEFWILKKISRNNDPELKCRYTMETFISKFYPGLNPFNRRNRDQYRLAFRLMYKFGLRERDGYWSYKFIRRRPIPRKNAKVRPPRYVKYPKGEFALIDFLQINGMRRYRENFQWARTFLRPHKLPSSTHYAKRDANGIIPAFISNTWQLPGPAFTTYQFQAMNNARKPTKEQWASAVAFLSQQGYKFDPEWKRWKKS